MSQPPPQPPRPAGPPPPPRPSGPPRVEAEEMFSVLDLAKLWHCSRDHIYDLVAKGELRTVSIGIGRAKTRIPASAAAEFIAKRSSKGRRAA